MMRKTEKKLKLNGKIIREEHNFPLLIAALYTFKAEYRNINEKLVNIRLQKMKLEFNSMYKGTGLDIPSKPFTYSDLNKNQKIEYNILKNIISNTFDQLLDILIAKKFVINIRNVDMLGFLDFLKEIEVETPVWRKIIDELEKGGQCFYEWSKNQQNDAEIDMIVQLLEFGQFGKLSEIIVSEKISADQKNSVLKTAIRFQPNALWSMDKTIPKSYHYLPDFKNGYSEKFRRLFHQNLIEALGSDTEYFKSCILEFTNRGKYSYPYHHLEVKRFLSFFVDYDLVNIDEILCSDEALFKYHKISCKHSDTPITLAAVAFIDGSSFVGEYLYSLPSYKNIDSTIKYNSDIVILESLFKPYKRALMNFIKLKEFTITPEKLNDFAKIILEKQLIDPDIVTLEELEDIINILLRKTKKEDYKVMQQIIGNIKMTFNSNLLKKEEETQKLRESRSKFTSLLKKINDTLLKSPPDTIIQKELKHGVQKKKARNL